MNAKEIKHLISSAEEQGFEVTLSGSGSDRFRPPDPARSLVFVSATPSEKRTIKNALALLRQAGYREE